MSREASISPTATNLQANRQPLSRLADQRGGASLSALRKLFEQLFEVQELSHEPAARGFHLPGGRDEHVQRLDAEAPQEVQVEPRLFLKAYRPFAIDVVNRAGEKLLRIERPFQFYFHTAQTFDGSGRLIGTLERHFSIPRRLYSVSA